MPLPKPETSAAPSETPPAPRPTVAPPGLPSAANEPAELPATPGTAAPESLSAEAVFKQASPAVVRIIVRDARFKEIGLGSGFLVSSAGVLVTNYHVVAKAHFATVLLPSDATLFVEGILASDEQADLAVLKVNGKDLPHLDLVSAGETPNVGAHVYAIGNPQGLANTLSEGLISGVRTLDPGTTVLQTTAAISPGSSGGPLLDARGRVVGVARMTLAGPATQNLNFAVPAEKVRAILDKASAGKPVPLSSAGGTPMAPQATRDLKDAWAAVDEQRWQDAVRILERLRKTDPSNPQVWFVLGVLHLQMGNHDLALEAFRKETQLAPDEATGHFGLGVAYQSSKRYPESVAALRTAIRLSPDFWPAYVQLGVSQYKMGLYAASVASLKTAVRLRPNDETAWYFLGLDYLALHDRVRATEAYEILGRLNADLAAELRTRLYAR
jgi:S1-C subfamily serine protease